ncbi:MAG: type III pantothenate kinase [bacterium]|nr:type III pantothenate kinase [bacterium]
MLLALDIGNTNTKSALFEGDAFIDFTVHSDSKVFNKYFDSISFTNVAISSVNKFSENKILELLSIKNVQIFRASSQNKFNFDIAYETPDTLGVDRLCSASGAFNLAVKNKLLSDDQYLLTIDFGTATTINIVSPDKKYLGGLIAPGLSTMLKALNEKTAQLPLPELKSYKGIIGTTTDSSILSGVITATIGMINETTFYLENRSKVFPLIYATGGNARYVLPYLDKRIIYDEALVLKGLKTIYDLNNPD